ncbi:TraB/VirB10 family protein [Shewanella sp. SM101]|jgi:conjugal transfer pilus assembly protein TraB|uniref:TraB/VirB10 family protein n=1 Tax=Shewanella TaxID=22 RepID=UPI0002112D8B|nr:MULTISPECIES: TraB/VirB10 family protein [Shewanella]AEH16226.1 TraB pilus assembly family protein [Shewanella baltica OS117]MCU8008949.1 TraB/VirB10 family protein [Shewanella sp. SM87]MCU8106900.1 TraB/VirB10 family protein [Shewanella sp. SM101]
MEQLDKLRAQWLALPANYRTIGIVVLLAAPAFFIAEAVFPSAPVNKPEATPVRSKPIFMSSMGSERLELTQTSGQLIAMRKKIQEREKAIDAQYTEQKAGEKRIQSQVDTLQMSQMDMTKRLETISHQMQMLVDSEVKAPRNQVGGAVQQAQPSNIAAATDNNFTLDPMASLKSSDVSIGPPPSKRLTMNRGELSIGKPAIESAEPVIAQQTNAQVVAKKSISQSDSGSNSKAEQVQDTWLSAGTVLPMTLLTGQHVPTSTSAQTNPAPVLLKIVDVGMMPNGFTIDLVGCMVVGSARGSASTSRVEIRAESISCIDQQGRAIEQPFVASAQGQDGHAGIPAKLVTRYGESIKQSFWAGIYGTGADTLTNMTNNKSNGGVYDSNYYKDSTGSAMAGGASSAFDKIADFYLELADEARPYLEMNGGIEGVDFIVQRGMGLKFKG